MICSATSAHGTATIAAVLQYGDRALHRPFEGGVWRPVLMSAASSGWVEG